MRGEPLRLLPGWTGPVYKLILFAAAAALVFAVTFHVNEWAIGAAFIRFPGHRSVTATASGTLASVDVRPGQRVKSGERLARLYGAHEKSELARIEMELQAALVKALTDPGDDGARQRLGALRAQKSLAEAQLDERALRAPCRGVVGDVRARAGQFVSPGEVVVTVIDEDTPPKLVAVLPGYARPLLRRGSPMRIELSGYRYVYRDLLIDEIGDEVLGPSEVRRQLGNDVADAMTVDGPSILVTAQLPGADFRFEGRSYRYHNGMPARAWGRLKQRSLLAAFIPAIRVLTGDR